MQPITLSSSRTTRQLFIALGVLLALHLSVAFGHMVLHLRLEALTQLLDLDLEANLPTFFNVFLFLTGAVLFLLHGRVAEPSMRRGWNLMAWVFLFLGIDEGSQIHEKFILFTWRLLHHGQQDGTELGWLYYAWVIPYGVAVAILGLLLMRWFLRLDFGLRKKLILSGVIYIFGAVLLEMAGGKLVSLHPFKDPGLYPWMPCEIYGGPAGCSLYMDLRYVALYTLEETCEMTGLILCICYLLQAFEARQLQISLSVAGTEPDGPPSAD